MKLGTINAFILVPTKIELNDNYIAQAHRYIYAVDPSPILKGQEIRPLYKLDTLTNKTEL